MPLALELGGITAQYTDGQWRSNDTDAGVVLDILNAAMREIETSGADPYPALTKTKEIAKRYRGKIVDEGHAPDAMPGRVY